MSGNSIIDSLALKGQFNEIVDLINENLENSFHVACLNGR